MSKKVKVYGIENALFLFNNMFDVKARRVIVIIVDVVVFFFF